MAPPIRTFLTLHGRRPQDNLAPGHASQQRVHDPVDLVVGWLPAVAFGPDHVDGIESFDHAPILPERRGRGQRLSHRRTGNRSHHQACT